MQLLGEIFHQGTSGRFLLSDSIEALSSLLPKYRGRVQLIYMDPPFVTGKCFDARVMHERKHWKFTAYADTSSLPNYLSYMTEILKYCKELLSKEGSLYLHCDYRSNASLRFLLDEVFGTRYFVNEIIWHYHSGGRSRSYFARKHDSILCYCKGRNRYFDIEAIALKESAPAPTHMRKETGEDGQLYYSIASNGKRYHYPAERIAYPDDVWSDIPHLHQRTPERCGYPTQKPLALIERILLSSSRTGDLILDPFSGSGTTAHCAVLHNRKFIAIDQSVHALRCIRSRLLTIPLWSPDFRIEYHKQLPPLTNRYPLCYAALGHSEAGYFYPVLVSPNQNTPAVISPHLHETNVLHQVDLSGAQCFTPL